MNCKNPVLKASDVNQNYIPTEEEKKRVRPDKTKFMLSGDKVFHTIQGEGNWIGRPTTFVRLHFCNLNCEWCLREDSLIRMANCALKPIKDIHVGEFIWSVTGESSKVLQKKKVPTKKYLKILLENGQELNITENHFIPVIENSLIKWKISSQLIPGDFLVGEQSKLHYSIFDLPKNNESNLPDLRKANEENIQYTLKTTRYNTAGIQGKNGTIPSCTPYNPIESEGNTRDTEFKDFMSNASSHCGQSTSLQIKKIEHIQEDCITYDLATEHHNYIANGVVVHNCDSWYTWKQNSKEFWQEPESIDISSLMELIVKEQVKKGLSSLCKRICFTGGEPLLHKTQIEEFMKQNPDWEVEIETNGTVMPTPYLLENAKFNCSPKLESSKNCLSLRYNIPVIEAISKTKSPCFKFVSLSIEDIDEVLEKFNCIPRSQMYIMPEGVTAQDNIKVYEKISSYIIEKGLCTSPRLQNIMFDGARRGV